MSKNGQENAELARSEGPTGGSRQTAASGDVSQVHNIDPDAGHNLAERACGPGKHRWVGYPFQTCANCGYSLQAIALTLGQDVNP